MTIKQAILITPGFTADETDLNCLPTLQLLVEELLRQQVEVHIIPLDYPFSGAPYQWKGAKIYPCNGCNKRWLKPRTFRRAMRTCLELVDNFSKNPQWQRNQVVLHSFWLGWASAIGEQVSKRRGIRHVTTLMGQDVLAKNRHWYRWLTEERQTRLVVLSDFQNRMLQKNAGRFATHVIPFGVSSSEIPSSFLDFRPIDILGVGSCIGLKNWVKWLDTLAILLRARPHMRATLLGDGPDRPFLQQYAEQLGLQVHFLGNLPRPQVLETMLQSKVLLHTSNYESQGFVLNEAAMCGCHVVATPVGIAPELGTCATDANELAALVAVALDSPGLTAPYTPFLIQQSVQEYLQVYTTAE